MCGYCRKPLLFLCSYWPSVQLVPCCFAILWKRSVVGLESVSYKFTIQFSCWRDHRCEMVCFCVVRGHGRICPHLIFGCSCMFWLFVFNFIVTQLSHCFDDTLVWRWCVWNSLLSKIATFFHVNSATFSVQNRNGMPVQWKLCLTTSVKWEAVVSQPIGMTVGQSVWQSNIIR